MVKYSITNLISGLELGDYEGDSPENAARAMFADAGIFSDEHAADVLGCDVSEIFDDFDILACMGRSWR